MNTSFHRSAPGPAPRPWIWATLALLAVAGLLVGAQHMPSFVTQAAAPTAQPVAAATGALIDHTVLDRGDLLPEPDTSPLSVAAYGS